MRDVIQKVIATEGEARLIVEAARTEADRILSDARMRGREIIDKARQEATGRAADIIEAATKAAEQEKQHLLADAAIAIESQIRLDQALRQWAIEGIIRCICKQL